jgi:hypothetical protein
MSPKESLAWWTWLGVSAVFAVFFAAMAKLGRMTLSYMNSNADWSCKPWYWVMFDAVHPYEGLALYFAVLLITEALVLR